MQDDTTGGGVATLERDQALDVVDEAADAQDRAVIDQAIDVFVEAGQAFSANDVRPLLPQVRPALIGARFMAASKAGRIVRIGWVTSTDPGTHARPIAHWMPAAGAP